MKERDEYGRGPMMIKIDDWIKSHPVMSTVIGLSFCAAAQLGGIGVVMYVLQGGLTRLAQGAA